MKVWGQIWEEELAADWIRANSRKTQLPWVCSGHGWEAVGFLLASGFCFFFIFKFF